ncbi:MAG: hypothetical protein QM606_05525 [Leucobacter sp.]
MTPGRAVIVAIPMLGFFATPFLPFAIEPTLWFGFPAVTVWCAILVIATVASLQIVDSLYLRNGGREQDDADRLLDEQAQAALDEADDAALGAAEGSR